MKNNHSNIYSFIKISLLIFSFLFVANNLHAQPPLPINIDNAPIDGGLSVLIASGIGYAIKRSYEKNRK
ncbi:MAG: hypothetical protein KGL19_16485 [Bacteroidota bacterium]|nr:hypothetical protein [Bacteroidota bacterium]